ncbi:MAG TPA: hypothetical protein VIU44_18545 [Gaiellaceae bacterium]
MNQMELKFSIIPSGADGVRTDAADGLYLILANTPFYPQVIAVGAERPSPDDIAAQFGDAYEVDQTFALAAPVDDPKNERVRQGHFVSVVLRRKGAPKLAALV